MVEFTVIDKKMGKLQKKARLLYKIFGIVL